MGNKLNNDSIVPLYEQVFQQLKHDIETGVYSETGRLPVETDLADMYEVSRITVRRAVNELVEQRLVEKKQGKGTFITKPKLSRNMKKLQSFSEMCEQIGVKPGAKMLENRLVEADGNVAAGLGVEPGSSVVLVSRLRYADQDPVQIERSYFPLKYSFLLDARFDDNSLFDYLREQSGARVASSEKVIELCRATSAEAAQLGVRKGSCLLFVRSTVYDQNDQPLYYGIQLINGGRFSLYVYEREMEPGM